MRALSPQQLFIQACQRGDGEGVRLGLEDGIDVNLVPPGGGSALLELCAGEPTPWAMELLIGAGADVNLLYDGTVTPLVLVCANPGGTLALVGKLIMAGANPNPPTGVSPLSHWCGAHGGKHIASLLALGMDPTREEEGHSSVSRLVGRGDYPGALMLMEAGSPPPSPHVLAAVRRSGQAGQVFVDDLARCLAAREKAALSTVLPKAPRVLGSRRL